MQRPGRFEAVACSGHLLKVLHDGVSDGQRGAAFSAQPLHVAHILHAADQRKPWILLGGQELVIGDPIHIPCKDPVAHDGFEVRLRHMIGMCGICFSAKLPAGPPNALMLTLTALGAVKDHSTFKDVTREERLNKLHHALPLQAILLSQRHPLGNDLNYAVLKRPCSGYTTFR